MGRVVGLAFLAYLDTFAQEGVEIDPVPMERDQRLDQGMMTFGLKGMLTASSIHAFFTDDRTFFMVIHRPFGVRSHEIRAVESAQPIFGPIWQKHGDTEEVVL